MRRGHSENAGPVSATALSQVPFLARSAPTLGLYPTKNLETLGECGQMRFLMRDPLYGNCAPITNASHYGAPEFRRHAMRDKDNAIFSLGTKKAFIN